MYEKKVHVSLHSLTLAAQRVEILSIGAFLFLLTLDLKNKNCYKSQCTEYDLTRSWILGRPDIRENDLLYTPSTLD